MGGSHEGEDGAGVGRAHGRECARLRGGVGGGGLSPTQITIKGPNGYFAGKILSANASCLGGRQRAGVHAVLAHDPFERIASDTSERQGDRGVWSVGNTGFRDGFFQARVTKTTTCRGARSRILELDNGVPQ